MSPDKLERRITTAQVVNITIPSFLTALVLILVLYLTSITSSVNNGLSLAACRSKVSQGIQETFRKDISELVLLSGQSSLDVKEKQEKLLKGISSRPNYVDEVLKNCGQL